MTVADRWRSTARQQVDVWCHDGCRQVTKHSSSAGRPLDMCCYDGCRQLTKHSSSAGRRAVFYLAPCRRRLRSESEVDLYLIITNSQLTIDMFCFDGDLRVDVEFISKQVDSRPSLCSIVLFMCYCFLCSCISSVNICIDVVYNRILWLMIFCSIAVLFRNSKMIVLICIVQLS